MDEDLTQVRAEMAANVWKLLVTESHVVEAGDPLFILESMKMEITVESPIGGRVVGIRVREGDTVTEGEVILVMNPIPGREDPGPSSTDAIGA